MSGGRDPSGNDDPRPQLQIFDDAARETAIGSILDGDTQWSLIVIVEPVARDLVRGRLSFRRGEERYDTAAVLVEETAEGVVRRATELPKAMLRQLLVSARGEPRPPPSRTDR